MSARVLATIRPDILVWARTSAGYSLDAAAVASKFGDALRAWESGEASPSISQLRALAALYKRPLSVFYLQEVPNGFMVVSDFRRADSSRYMHFSPELTLEIRLSNQRRALARELMIELGEEPKVLDLEFSYKIHPEEAGLMLRRWLGIPLDKQPFKSDKSGRSGLNLWREKIESKGVLVFQAIRINSEEASGFAIYYPELPIVVINRKDAPVRRLFSLLHELAHLALRRSGVSELDVDSPRPPENQELEAYCNQVAASALMPSHLFNNDPILKAHDDRQDWANGEISQLAAKFGVSREAIVRRLLTFTRASQPFYLAKRQEYQKEYVEYQEQEKQARVGKEMKRNMPQEALSNYGRKYLDLVYQSYYQDRLTLSEMSGYLGLRVGHVLALGHKLEG